MTFGILRMRVSDEEQRHLEDIHDRLSTICLKWILHFFGHDNKNWWPKTSFKNLFVSISIDALSCFLSCVFLKFWCYVNFCPCACLSCCHVFLSCVCVCVCMYVHMCVCICMYMHVYICKALRANPRLGALSSLCYYYYYLLPTK